MAGVVLENVSRVYPGGVVAVDRVNLAVNDRELLVLVGPSGCGKSTTLRMIAGLEEVSAGQIHIGGQVVNHVAPKDRNIAMVFQNYALYPHMTVYKNMAFGLELRYGGSWIQRCVWRVVRPRKAAELARRRYEIAEQVHKTASILGIEHLLERMPRQLSGGERQRVALGRAIVRQPAAFLFDEPLSNLDAKLRGETRRELKQLHRRLAATMIYVTHDQVEALTLGERIAVMDRGRIQQIGPPMEVYDRPRNLFVAGFIGTPPMNLLPGSIVKNSTHIAFRRDSWSLALEGAVAARLEGFEQRPVVLGIRAEDVSVLSPGQQMPQGLAAEVSVVEPVGDATLVNLELAEGGSEGQRVTLLGKIEPRATIRPGQQVTVMLNMQRSHVFDQATGENVLYGSEGT